MEPRYRLIRTLVVEDSLDDIVIAQRALERSGVTGKFVIARDGQEALDLMMGSAAVERLEELDLVVLDINLPRVNGLEVLARVRADERLAGLPIVMLTASAREEDVLASYRLGANTFIQKPVVFEQFLSALQTFADYWYRVATLPPMRSVGVPR